MTARAAKEAATTASSNYSSNRYAEQFNNFYAEFVSEASEKRDPPVLPRYRKKPRRLDDGEQPVQFGEPKDYFRQQYYEVHDLAISELERRFSQSSFTTAIEI